MPKYRILLVEELVESDCAEFDVTASTPEAAAAILIGAHDQAREDCSSWVSLPDGQRRHIEPDNVVRTRVFCVLLDEEGNEVREIDPNNSEAPSPSDANIAFKERTS
ncbi:MAG: hypothetical protein WBO09_01775 [Methylocystis silviterrae]|uniref:hypothetical protein n=1 Tax=Methylocystis silviterrae TaxID=2743612 RepID=UPI003C70AE75